MPRINLTELIAEQFNPLNVARVEIGGNASTARPDVDWVIWTGYVEPANAIDTDLVILRVEPFNPLAQVVPLHAAWASDPLWAAPSDGGFIDSWRNESGEHLTEEGVGRPTFVAEAATLGDRPAVRFASGDKIAVELAAPVATPFKFLVVASSSVSTGSRRAVGFGTASTNGVGRLTSGEWSLVNDGGSITGDAADTAGHVFRGTVDGASSELDVDGVTDAGTLGSAGITRLVVGRGENPDRSSSHLWIGDVAFVGIYSAATLDADLEALATALADYYGL